MIRIYTGLLLICLLFSSGCSLKYLGPHQEDGGFRFSLKARGAKKVAIAGSFNQWDTGRDLLSGPDNDGVWTVVLPLTEGRYEYLFLVDGTKWVLDPEAPFEDDGFGGRDSVVVVGRQ